MSCDKCDEAEDEGRISYYKLDDAEIGIIACDAHLRKAFDRLGVGEKVLRKRDMYMGRTTMMQDELEEASRILLSLIGNTPIRVLVGAEKAGYEWIKEHRLSTRERGLASSKEITNKLLVDTTPKCSICGKPASCMGQYDGTPWSYACNECCGHGCEDGQCYEIDKIPERFAFELDQCKEAEEELEVLKNERINLESELNQLRERGL